MVSLVHEHVLPVCSGWPKTQRGRAVWLSLGSSDLHTKCHLGTSRMRKLSGPTSPTESEALGVINKPREILESDQV